MYMPATVWTVWIESAHWFEDEFACSTLRSSLLATWNNEFFSRPLQMIVAGMSLAWVIYDLPATSGQKLVVVAASSAFETWPLNDIDRLNGSSRHDRRRRCSE